MRKSTARPTATVRPRRRLSYAVTKPRSSRASTATPPKSSTTSESVRSKWLTSLKRLDTLIAAKSGTSSSGQPASDSASSDPNSPT